MALESNLIAALIGGGLALSGTVVAQVFTLISSRIQRRHNRDVRRCWILDAGYKMAVAAVADRRIFPLCAHFQVACIFGKND
jgi:hypothetical protein